jgi:acetylglutamate kinase
MFDPQVQADVLNQALPYIQAFRGQTFVVKYGGSAMRDRVLMEGVIRNVLLLQLVGVRPILVHGGGPEIDTWLGKLSIEKRTIGGLRVTDEATMDIVEMALAGRANKSLVAEVQRVGGKAIGLSGRDADLLQGVPISAELGRVGAVTHVNPDVLVMATEAGYIPVVCSVATDAEHRALNVNADTAAAAIAAAVGASKLILLTDTNGVLDDKDRPESTISTLSPSQAEEMIATGKADRGMIPKLEAALHAVQNGVASVHMINGGTPNGLLIEVFTDRGVGTMVSPFSYSEDA